MSPSMMLPVSGSCSVAMVRISAAFARAVGPQQAKHAVGNGERHAAQGPHAVGVGFGKIINPKFHIVNELVGRPGKSGDLQHSKIL